MSRDRLREASDILAEASDDVANDETRDRLRDQASQLRSLASRDRVPDHGRLDRHQHVIREIMNEADEIATQLKTVNELITSVREELEGV